MQTPTLTAEQRLALAGLEWFVAQSNARKGRTHVMALAIMREALRNPGKSQPLVDHFPGASGERAMRATMISLLDVYGLSPFATLTTSAVRIDAPDSSCDVYASYAQARDALLKL